MSTPSADGPQRAQTTPSNSAKGSRWRMRNWRLRTKVMAVIVVPTVTALILGGLRAYGDLERASTLRQTVSQVRVAQNITNVVQELQKERTLSVAWVASGKKIPRSELNTQTRVVNDAVASARKAVDRLDTGNNATQRRYEIGLQRLSALNAIRNAAGKTNYPDVGVYSGYSSILDSLVRLGREVNVAVTDRDLLDQGTVIQSLSDAKENIAKENAILQIAAYRKELPADLLSQLRDAHASAEGATENYRANASPGQLQLYSDTVSGPRVDQRERILAQAIAAAESSPQDKDKPDQGIDQGIDQGTDQTTDEKKNKKKLHIDRDDLTIASTTTMGDLRKVETKLLERMRASADGLAAGASRAAVQDAVIVLVALVLALILMALVTGSLLRPLRRLRGEALAVADHRLPDTVTRILANPDPGKAVAEHAVVPVAVFTREETGQVARAFDAVQEQAIRMATEQALLRDNINSIFVNLSRRSQSLVERQLSLIDGLESEEQDPDQLSSLFELDHLATRMRRNSESLLVLSGVGLSRQFNRSVPAGEIVGAAVSEVEQYARVEVAEAPGVVVQGRVASDLVHLVAELLDNATFFSEPDKKVKVRLAVTRNGGLGIQITDQGVGMPPDEIEVANQRLADPPDLDVAVTKRMGLYVVARLAKRHDVQVHLRENEDIEGGLVARITVPSTVVQPIDKPAAASGPPNAFPASSNGHAHVASQPATQNHGRATIGTSLFDATPPPEDDGQPTPGDGGRAGYYLPPPGTDAPLPGDDEEEAGEATERLPIFDAVSQWFADSDTSDRTADAVAATPTNGVANAPPDAAETTQSWTSPGDEGWRAAQSLVDGTPERSTTASGLPKRVPRAHLVPGSAQQAPVPQPVDAGRAAEAAPRPQRSAEVVRGRMSSFQEGTRRGRHEAASEAGTQQGPQQNQQSEEQE